MILRTTGRGGRLRQCLGLTAVSRGLSGALDLRPICHPKNHDALPGDGRYPPRLRSQVGLQMIGGSPARSRPTACRPIDRFDKGYTRAVPSRPSQIEPYSDRSPEENIKQCMMSAIVTDHRDRGTLIFRPVRCRHRRQAEEYAGPPRRMLGLVRVRVPSVPVISTRRGIIRDRRQSSPARTSRDARVADSSIATAVSFSSLNGIEYVPLRLHANRVFQQPASKQVDGMYR